MQARPAPHLRQLWRTAQGLARAAVLRHAGRPLPPLLFFTDPVRTPNPVRIAEQLPSGAGVVFRHFGAANAEAVGAALAEVACRRGLMLLIGNDEALAMRLGAHGLHLPERRLGDAPGVRRRRPGWLLTGAAHSAGALRRATELQLDAAVLSPVFRSRSPSAGPALGALRARALAKGAGLPVFALGGVSKRTAPQLEGSGFAGLAAIDGLLTREQS